MLVGMTASGIDIETVGSEWTTRQWMTALAPGIFAAFFFAGRAEFAPLSSSGLSGWVHLVFGLVLFSLWAPITWGAWHLHRHTLEQNRNALTILCVHTAFGTVLASMVLFLVSCAAVQMNPHVPFEQVWRVFEYKWLSFFPFLILLYGATVHAFHGRQRMRSTTPVETQVAPIVFWWNGQQLLVPPKTIRWVEAQGDYVTLHTDNNQYTLKITLNTLEKRLKPAGFTRTRRNALVNIQHIDAILPAGRSTYKLKLNNGDLAPLARRNKKSLILAMQFIGTNHLQ